MSLILDALRKSEAERRRGQLPALALELPPAPSRRAPARAWWIALPVMAALAAAAWLAAGSMDAPAPGASAGDAEPTPAPADAARRVARPVAPPVTVRTAPALPRDAVRDERPAPRATGPAPAPAHAPAPMRPVPLPAGPPPAVAATPDASTVLALADLSPAERRALPPLKLSMHMWSPDAARRFAIVDGQRLVEGDRIGNAVVERIEPDGVVLASDGRLVRVPLP